MLQLVVLNQIHGGMFCSNCKESMYVGRTIDNNIYCIFILQLSTLYFAWSIVFFLEFYVIVSWDRKDTKLCILPNLHYEFSLSIRGLVQRLHLQIHICLAMLFHLPLSSNNQTCCKNIILPCLPIRPQVLLKTPTYMLSNSFLIHRFLHLL